jgi:hypothetical protein
LFVALAAVAIWLSAAPAGAGAALPFVEFNPSTINVTPGDTGTLELDLVNGAGPFDLLKFNLDIEVSPPSANSFSVGTSFATKSPLGGRAIGTRCAAG